MLAPSRHETATDGPPRRRRRHAGLGAARPRRPGVADEVTTLADSGARSLRSAIANTAPGGNVTFAPALSGGTILLGSELTIDKDLTIDGPSAKDLTISGDDSTRVFRITGGADATIEDVTIRDGRAAGQEPVGAGVLSFDGDVVTLSRVVLRDNEARLSPTDGVVPSDRASTWP